MKIKPIKEAPECIEQAAKYYQLHWGEYLPDKKFSFWLEQIHINNDSFPITFIAIDDASTESES